MTFFTDGPTDITLHPMRSVYRPGDSVTCSAKSNPIPEFQWENLDTGNVSLGAELHIVEAMISETLYIFRCTTMNIDKEGRTRMKSQDIHFLVTRSGLF